MLAIGRTLMARPRLAVFDEISLGLAPIVIALLSATGWILASSHGDPLANWRPWLLTAIATLVVWRTKVHILVLIGTGGLLGWLGWV